MAKLSASGVVTGAPNPMVLLSDVRATSEYRYDAAFDSTLAAGGGPNSNYTLRINLRVFLKQITPNYLTDVMARTIETTMGRRIDPARSVGYYADADSKASLIKDWQGTEWINFTKKFTDQAKKWNRRFWLLPPDDFPFFDYIQGSSRFRPNIVCELGVQIVYMIGWAHHTIEVVNLYTPNNTFRSHSGLYSIEDTAEGPTWSLDMMNQWRNHKQTTVIHEIGHAIGLPHIGQTRSLPHCTLAITMNKVLPDAGVPAFYRGGSNASPCYGSYASYGDADNIMGTGDKFSAENAQPWLDRLPHHLRVITDIKKWQVSMTEVPPMSLVGFRR